MINNDEKVIDDDEEIIDNNEEVIDNNDHNKVINNDEKVKGHNCRCSTKNNLIALILQWSYFQQNLQLN